MSITVEFPVVSCASPVSCQVQPGTRYRPVVGIAISLSANSIPHLLCLLKWYRLEDSET